MLMAASYMGASMAYFFSGFMSNLSCSAVASSSVVGAKICATSPHAVLRNKACSCIEICFTPVLRHFPFAAPRWFL
jgi:hypothetical protein